MASLFDRAHAQMFPHSQVKDGVTRICSKVKNMFKQMKLRPSSWCRDEDGSSTIEFLLWVPVLMLMLTISTDATLLMHQQQNFYNAARDASRQVALGVKNEADAKAALLERFSGVEGIDATVTQLNGYVTTSVMAPFSSFTKFSGLFVNGTLRGDVTMWVEDYDS